MKSKSKTLMMVKSHPN